jgi:hypothetical protein
VQPRLERVAAVHGDLLHAEPLDTRMVDGVTARGALQRRRRGLEAGLLGDRERALEGGGPASVGDRRAVALELVGRRGVQPGGDEQSVQ